MYVNMSTFLGYVYAYKRLFVCKLPSNECPCLRGNVAFYVLMCMCTYMYICIYIYTYVSNMYI